MIPGLLRSTRSGGGGKGKAEFLARPSGFEEYEVGDRVTVLKDADTDRESQTWKDDQEFDKEIWRIVPVTFWKKDEEEGVSHEHDHRSHRRRLWPDGKRGNGPI